MTIDQQIPEGQHFRVSGGPALPSALALRAYLRMIPAPQFASHVDVERKRNDFADWIEHAFGERELAKRLRGCRTREQMVWALDDAFAELRMARVVAGEEAGAPAQAPSAESQIGNTDPVAMREDGGFDKLKGDIVATNERVSAKYDELARQMQEAMANPMPKELERLAEQLRSRHADLLAKISETRKGGKDTLIPSLVARQFAPKLSLAVATREQKDFEFARIVLDEVEAELRAVQEAPEQDLKKEVLRLAGLDGATKAK